MFSSVNKTFGCCSKTFGIAATKVLFVVPNFVTVTKPFFHCGKIIFEKSVAGAKSVCEWLKPGDQSFEMQADRNDAICQNDEFVWHKYESRRGVERCTNGLREPVWEINSIRLPSKRVLFLPHALRSSRYPFSTDYIRNKHSAKTNAILNREKLSFTIGQCEIIQHSKLSVKNLHGKNGFVTATKLGTTDKYFVAGTKTFASATKRFVDSRTIVVVTKCFCYPYFNKYGCARVLQNIFAIFNETPKSI